MASIWSSHRPGALRSPSKFPLLLVLLVFLITPLASCGGSGTPQEQTISVTDNDFTPKELHISVGQTVYWINHGQSPHTVTADNGSFDSGTFNTDAMYTHTFTTPGRYPYYCTLHGGAGGVGMAGVIVVGNASSTNISVADIVSHSQFHARTSPYTILHVPADFPTIQKAVDTAKPGDMVMIDPGVYHEAVTVHTPHITIRGRDRQSVIMEGDFKLSNAFKVVDGTDGVVIENMTARHYVGNGFFWDGVNGYRGSYLTAYANGDYGVYAYDSVMGQFDHDYAAGHPDSGFYIGQCHPCHAIIADVISEGNALGYSGTNAGGDLVIRDSIWRNNMSGITPNTLDSEKYPPEDGTTIINNLIENNSNYNAPTGKSEYPSIGNGIVIAGGNNNVIVGNRINGHIYYGVLIVPNIDQNFWEPSGNVVKGNIITNSGVADLALAALSAGNNCFSGNMVGRTVPPFLQTTHACGSLLAYAGGGDPSVTVILFDHFMQISQGRVKIADWKKGIEPADAKNQPGMPDTTIDPQGIFTPIEGKPDMTISATTISPGITLGGLGLANPFFEVLLGFYAYFLPLALYGAWISVATWDIVRRTDLKDRARIGWMAVVYLIPVLGPLAYFLFGKSEISRNIRLALAIGAPLVYLVLLVVLLFTVS
jgi:plastocyanin/uncharacterized membrane protein YhaH (DUF805 family)